MVRGKQFGNGLQKGPPTDGSGTFRLEPSSGVVNRDRLASRHGQEARQQVENKTGAEQDGDQDDTFHGESLSMFWAIAKIPSRQHLKDVNPAEMTRRKTNDFASNRRTCCRARPRDCGFLGPPGTGRMTDVTQAVTAVIARDEQ